MVVWIPDCYSGAIWITDHYRATEYWTFWPLYVCHQFLSISYWSNREYWSQKLTQKIAQVKHLWHHLKTSRGGLGPLFINQIQVDWAKCPVVRIPLEAWYWLLTHLSNFYLGDLRSYQGNIEYQKRHLIQFTTASGLRYASSPVLPSTRYIDDA